MSSSTPFTRENLDFFLKELAKEFKKLGGRNMPAEIILIGGASILTNYGFRDMTYDMDTVILTSSAIKEAINRVGDKYGLPNGWLNTNFKRTKSYTPKLIQFSVYYKTFSNILTVRTVTAEYLIAMKLMSGRMYRNDLSDVVGIIIEHNATGKPINFKQIDKAVCNLYGSWDDISDELRKFVVSVLEQPDYTKLYEQYRKSEKQSKDILLEFKREHPDTLKEDDINVILKKARQKKQSRNEPKR